MIQYTKTWGGSSSDVGLGVAVDSSGNKYVTGYTNSFGPGNPKSAVLLLKYGSSGVLLWQRIWSGSGNGSDVGSGVALDASGNIYVTGYTSSFGAGGDDVLLLKFNSTGSLLWQKTWGGINSDLGIGVVLDASGNIYVSGFTGSFGSGKVVLLKFDSTGSLLWQRTWGGSIYDYGEGVALDASGNIYVTGYTLSFGAGGVDLVLLKFDSTGSLLWQKTWGGSGAEYGQSVAVDASGNIYVTGHTNSFGAGMDDVLLLKFDSTSGLLWQRTWGGSKNEGGSGVAVDASGNVYVAGYTNSFGAGGNDVLLLKLSSAGSLLNQEIYGGGGDDVGVGVAVDSAGNAFITGYVSEAPPYNSTTTGNSTLGAPTFLLGNPSFTLGTPTAIAQTPTGSAATPSGSQTYAGSQDSFLTQYGPTPKAPLSASLITLVGLLLIPIILSRRRNLRE